MEYDYYLTGGNDMLKKYLFCILAIAISACTNSEPVLYVELEYINNSSHGITLDFHLGEAVEFDRYTIEIPAGGAEVVTYGGWESNIPQLVLPVSADIMYDGTVYIEHKSKDVSGEYNNVCHEDNYIMERLDRKAQKYRYSFTFTEADYEYAVSAGGSGKDGN